MDIEYVRNKLGMDSNALFASTSSSDTPYYIEIKPDMSFQFESESYDKTYYAETEKELVIAARDCIAKFENLSRTAIQGSGEKEFEWESGAVSMKATYVREGMYKVFRTNKMVGSQMELARLNSKYSVLRKVGMYSQTDIDFHVAEDALYVFLSNFESTRISKEDYYESMRWTLRVLDKLEGRQVRPRHKLNPNQAGMLARPVRAMYQGKEIEGQMLTIRSGATAEIVNKELGIIVVPKEDIWIK